MQDPEFRLFIERVKLRSPIEVLVGERVSGLRQRGALWWACCPFHQEKTASFAVDPRRATWRCFGACGEGGDVLSFVERFDGLSFLDALRLLARQCGEDFPESTLSRRARGAEAELEERHDLLRWAAAAYRAAWRGPEAGAARAYMEKRGFSEATLEAFGVGWASDGGQFLVQSAQRERKSLEWLADAGLVRRAESGRPYDFFRGRVLIPIRDRLGRVVGFGGRILAAPPEGAPPAPKYVNTPETPFFHKGRLIFGLDLAAGEIRRTHRILIVEGYTDVMAAHQGGWSNAVAVLGTATTDEHAALIRRSGARQIVLTFDGDEAGRKATARALSGLLRLPVEVRVAVLPEGRDPGDLLADPALASIFRERVEGAQEWFDWSLEGLRGKRGAELATAVEERFQLLQRLARPLERSSRLGEMARFLQLPEADVREQWASFQRAQRPETRPVELSSAPPPRSAPSPHSSGLERAYGLLIGALLVDNSLVPVHAGLLPSCPDGDLKLLFETLLRLHASEECDEPIDASALMTALGEHPARARAVALETQALEAESAEALARDQARWIERARRTVELEALKGALGAPGIAPDPKSSVLERLHRDLRLDRVPAHRARPSPSNP